MSHGKVALSPVRHEDTLEIKKKIKIIKLSSVNISLAYTTDVCITIKLKLLRLNVIFKKKQLLCSSVKTVVGLLLLFLF